MKRMYVGIMVVLFVALTTTVFAYGPRAGYGPGNCIGAGGGPGPGFGGFAANLNLSKEQTEKMWQAREKFQNETQKMRYEMFQKRLEMKDLFADPKADEATILAKQKELNALRQNLQEKMVQFRLEQRKVLTPEQLKKASEYGPGFAKGYGPGRGSWGRGSGYGPCRNW